MKNLLLSATMVVLFCTAVFSGNLTKVCNLHRGDDVLVKRGVEFVAPDSAGADAVWNFRPLKAVDGGCRVTYYQDTVDLAHVTCVEQETGYDMYMTGDTMVVRGYFNRTLNIKYSVPEPVIRFPFAMGDTLRGKFEAKGYYSQRIPLKLSGESLIVGDGHGELITPDGDTLRDVTRVHTVRGCRLIMKDTLNLVHDKYAWYAPGFRYPVFETITTRYIKADSSEVPHMGVSFYYSPERQVEHLAQDMANDSVWDVMLARRQAEADSLALANKGKESNGAGFAPGSAIEYLRLYPVPAITVLTVDYALKREAAVTAELYDRAFRKLRCMDWGRVPEGVRREGIDVSTLPPGQYHIHITVAGEIVKMAFVKGI